MALRTTPVGPVIQANNESAEGIREAFQIIASGSQGCFGAADLDVAQHAGTPGMSVDIAAGRALILGSSTSFQGMYHLSNDAVVNLAIATAPGSNQRIDIVCASIQDAAYAGMSNRGLLQVVTGTAGSSPTVPATPASSIVLAHVFVGTSVTSILNANINGTTGTNNPDTVAYTNPRCVGLLGQAVASGSSITATTAGTAIGGLAIIANAPASHNIRVRVNAVIQLSAATEETVEIYKDGSGVTASISAASLGAAGGVNIVSEFIDQPTAGLHSYTVSCWASGACTQVITAGRCLMTVEDMGPI